MSDEYNVKGSSIRSKFDYVREFFGEEGERRLKERLDGHRELWTALDSKMYPFTAYDEVNRAIADEFYGGRMEELTAVGRYSARQVLTTVYRAFAAGKDFAGFLRRAAILHERFYDRGSMAVTLGDDGKSATIALTGAPTYSEADLQIAAGFYAGAAELLGVESYDSAFEWDDSGARYRLRWV